MTKNDYIDRAINALMERQEEAMTTLRRAVNDFEDIEAGDFRKIPLMVEIKTSRAIIRCCSEEIVKLSNMYDYNG